MDNLLTIAHARERNLWRPVLVDGGSFVGKINEPRAELANTGGLAISSEHVVWQTESLTVIIPLKPGRGLVSSTLHRGDLYLAPAQERSWREIALRR